MKKGKKGHIGNIGRGILEGLGELVVTVLFFGIGALIASFFGVDSESATVDSELIVLLGILVFFLIFGIIYLSVRWLKKIIRKMRN